MWAVFIKVPSVRDTELMKKGLSSLGTPLLIQSEEEFNIERKPRKMYIAKAGGKQVVSPTRPGN